MTATNRPSECQFDVLLEICSDASACQRLESWLNSSGWSNIQRVSSLRDPSVVMQIGTLKAPVPVIWIDRGRVRAWLWRGPQRMCPGCLHLRATALLPRQEIRALYENRAFGVDNLHWLTSFSREPICSLLVHACRGNDHHQLVGYEMDLATHRIRNFDVEPHSDCPLCSSRIQDEPEGSVIELLPEAGSDDGRGRVKKAAGILLPVQRYLNPTCGMLGESAAYNRHHEFTALVTGSFVEPGTRPMSLSWSGRQMSLGNSLIVGLLEALERHAGLRMRGKIPSVYDSYQNLQGDAIDPRSCGVYEDASYGGDTDLANFSEDLKIRWVWGYSLTDQRPILVPVQSVYYGNRFQDEPNFIHETSSGCATGVCLEEAILFGMLELIERDAFMIHWVARISPPQIDPATVPDPKLGLFIERLNRNDLDVYLLDTRLDIPVPSITGVAVRRDQSLGRCSVAAGCHFDPQTAMMSALAEVAGYQGGFKARTEAIANKLRTAMNDWKLVRTMADHGALYGLPEAAVHMQFLLDGPRLPFDDAYGDWVSSNSKINSLAAAIARCLEFFSLAGLRQVIVVDQTTPEETRAGLRSARVLVPGITPMDFGFGRCRAASLPRVYSVPVALGLRNAPMSPDQLNRVPHPFS